MNKFMAILLGAFVLIIASMVSDFWLISHGFGEYGAGFWAFLTCATTGEIVSFSLYQTAKQGGIKKAATTIFSGNKLIELESKEEPDGEV